MSQKEAALQIGVDPSTLARWERDERKPTATFGEAVNDFLEDREVRTCGKAG
jgi:transcriptional regulator with XRE-family HTH domain